MSGLMRLLRRNELVNEFLNLKGNARACIWPEPLWGIPYNLYKPYVTLYMLALGLSMTQIGMITTIMYVAQVISSVLSGVMADKLGRRWCTVIFDTLSWSVPEILWCFSQNFTWFVVAALFNGMWKITDNSWGLLLTEDMEKEKIMPVYSMASCTGVIAAFFAPLSKFAVDAFGLVPAMRVMYGVTFVSMTAKFLIVFFVSHETAPGKKRMELTKNKSVFRMIWECKDVYLRIIREKRMLLTLGIMAVYALITAVNDNWWSVFVVKNLGVAESNVSWFSMIKGLITLLAILIQVPRARKMYFKRPMLTSVALFALSQALLMLLGLTGVSGALLWALLIVVVGLEASSMALLSPLVSSILFINADPDERARVCGMIYATVSLMICVFPTMIGALADVSLYLPFAIDLMLFGLLALFTVKISALPAPAEG